MLATADPVYPPELIALGFTLGPVNDLSDNGVDTDGNVEDDPTVYPIERSMEPSGLTVSKTASRVIVERGSVVLYTITITNENVVVSSELDIIDILPPGFLYQPDSATLEGAPFDVVVNGRSMTWPRVRMPPLTTITATTKVVRVDLNDRAFATGADGKTGLTKPLAAGIDKLLAQLQGEPVNLRLAYHLPRGQDDAATRKQAARNTALVEKYMRKVWARSGGGS